MSGRLDARPLADAVKVAVGAQLGPNDVYEYRQVPGADGNAGTLPDIFVLVSIERRYNPNLRSTARAGSTGWRVSARSLGRTVDEARWAMNRVSLALNERRLVVDGATSTPMQFESDQAPTWDDGRFSGVALFTFAI